MEAVGLICDPEDLRQAINDRRRELGLTMLSLDHVSGVQSGYSAKLLARAPIKGFGPLALSSLLGALGLRLILVSDDAAIPRVTLSAMEGSPRHNPDHKSQGVAPAAVPVPEAA